MNSAFKQMRRKDKEITKEAIAELLTTEEYGFLSTISDNGYPYVVPVNFVYYDNSIYFHCATDGHKLDNIKRNDKVSFCVATDIELLPKKFDTKYKSVVAFGTASEVEDDSKEDILFKIIEKYSESFLIEGKKYIEVAKNKTKVIKIDIKHVTGKSND